MIEEVRLETEQEDYKKTLSELAEIAEKVEALIEVEEKGLIERQKERDTERQQKIDKGLLEM